MTDRVSRRSLGLAAGVAAASAVAPNIVSAQTPNNPEKSTMVETRKVRFEKLAAATVRIMLPDGIGLGSGYHFIQPDIIISNAHVALDARALGKSLKADSEQGSWDLKILASSPPDKFDFAIMRATGSGLEKANFLKPDQNTNCERGEEILFSGYPHGINPLIVARADIISPRSGNNFYFDGMIHGGNSGGPIVDFNSLLVKGTVTARRFLGAPEMSEADKELSSLQAYLKSIQGVGSVSIMGVDFSKFAFVMSRIASLTNELIRSNSTTGIGIGNSIEPVTAWCNSMGIG